MANSVEQRPSSKADSFSTCREIPRILGNAEISLPRPKQRTIPAQVFQVDYSLHVYSPVPIMHLSATPQVPFW
jgi:hypothetical protein